MEWFGLTSLGYSDPVKDMMHPDYKEPEEQENILVSIEKGTLKRPFSELVAELDCYLGQVDGNAYRSYERLIKMRTKYVFKPVGPTDMYKYAGTNAMNYGFWKVDEALRGEDWYKQRNFHPNPTSEISRYFNQVLKTDKFFRM